MVRSGALTLGAIVMLGGATGARAGNPKGFFDATQTASFFPLCGLFFRHIPRNRGDLLAPFNLSEAVGHNSNKAVPVNGAVSQADEPIGVSSTLYLCTSPIAGNDNPQ
jgi:hypothetical protein